MDSLNELLKSEIEKKKRQINKVESGGRKYFRKGDINKLQEEEYLKQQKLESEKAKKQADKDEQSEPENEKEKEEEQDSIIAKLPEEEVIRRLRSKDQPIRLFGETDSHRHLRLRALELIEERTDGQRNDFMNILEAIDSDIKNQNLEKEGNSKKSKDYSYLNIDTSELSVDLLRTDTDRAYGLVYIYYKRALKEWEQDIANRSEEVKRSAAGKKAAATMMQTTDYIKPFFRQLKKKTLDMDVLKYIVNIAIQLKQREYAKANDYYLRLSIGNAPWPIGVTMVGIHERSGREKIHSNQIAHVLNDETQRKWIQSIKRIMTFLQNKYPPEDLSKCVG
ncbi:Prp18-domain-containing protein [Neoconidiobolus thromboides FSU 785]|nr:Prp18-domain-containing protein [Neoconidiobolus thromboides FSU 785]